MKWNLIGFSNRNDQDMKVPIAGTYLDPVNQPPPSILPPSYEAVTSPTVQPYPSQSNAQLYKTSQPTSHVTPSAPSNQPLLVQPVQPVDPAVNEIARMQMEQIESRKKCFKFGCPVLIFCTVFLLIWVFGFGLTDIFSSSYQNYYEDFMGERTYIVRTKSNEFVKLVNGVDNHPSSGILLVRRLDVSYDPEWTTVCYYSFDSPSRACEDLGFKSVESYLASNANEINGGEWAVRDGFSKTYHGARYTESEVSCSYTNSWEKPEFIDHRPYSTLTCVRDETKTRHCDDKCCAYNNLVWLNCEKGTDKIKPRKIKDLDLPN